jgi:hypothetical protein
MGKAMIDVNITITEVTRTGEAQWRLATEGWRIYHAAARRADGSVVVDFEAHDARTAKPARIRFTLNRQGTKLEGFYSNPYNPSGHTTWETLYVGLDRYVVRPGWAPTPAEVLPAADARDLETASVESAVPRLVGTWTGNILFPRTSPRVWYPIRAVQPDGTRWQATVVNPRFTAAVIEGDHGLVRLHSEWHPPTGVVMPMWLWLQRGGNDLVGVVLVPWSDTLWPVRLSRGGGSLQAERGSEGEPALPPADQAPPAQPPDIAGGR